MKVEEMKRFNKDIIKYSSYYGVFDYVANYIQEFLEILFDKQIPFPIPVDDILKKLEISVEFSPLQKYKDLASINFNNLHRGEKAYILMSKTMNSVIYSNQSNWLKIKCIGKYIMYIEEIIDEKRDFAAPELMLAFPGETLPQMLAYELMLPYKQALRYFLEGTFFEKINDKYLWLRNKDITIGKCIDLNYPDDKKMFAYYHLLQTLEAKAFLKKIDINQYEEFQKAIWDFSGKAFEK